MYFDMYNSLFMLIFIRFSWIFKKAKTPKTPLLSAFSGFLMGSVDKKDTRCRSSCQIKSGRILITDCRLQPWASVINRSLVQKR